MPTARGPQTASTSAKGLLLIFGSLAAQRLDGIDGGGAQGWNDAGGGGAEQEEQGDGGEDQRVVRVVPGPPGISSKSFDSKSDNVVPRGRVIIWEREGRRVCAVCGEPVIVAANNRQRTLISA